MKNRHRTILISLVATSIYLSGYIVCRCQGELIHRKTWDGGWNRHWVTPGRAQPGFVALPAASLHDPGDVESDAAVERFRREFQAIVIRRRVMGICFLPLRCAESAAWWIVDPRE